MKQLVKGIFLLCIFTINIHAQEKKKISNKNNKEIVLSRTEYAEKLHGFWLGQCIANWTGLVTEMDKVGNIGEFKTGAFYTRNDWSKKDQPSIWGQGIPSNLSENIDFVFEDKNNIWGSDDDTDIEYIYQELLLKHKTPFLTGEQIRDGWLKHIKKEEENYLWVSNQKAFDLMQQGFVPPATGDPKNNPEFEMIDAQLTTEIFGLYAPTRPDVALKMAKLPIQNTARFNAEWISQFYVAMYALSAQNHNNWTTEKQIFWMAEQAKNVLPKDSYAFKMYQFVKKEYLANKPWEDVRDALYQRYQVEQADGYNMTSQNKYCNGCFAAGINFAASLVSLFYGKGDYIETIKIGTLAGWDSDNPTATWGGMIGFMIGKKGIEKAFGRTFSNQFNIHRTRIGFPNNGMDTFENMAKKGLEITDNVVTTQLGGRIDSKNNTYVIPIK